MAISKKTRFTVFERDNFACQYCGKTPIGDGVRLEVDHAISRKNGGSDHEDNLVAACFDCNRGKGRKSVAPQIDIKTKLKNAKEQLEQVKAMTKLLSLERKIKKEQFSWLEIMLKGYNKRLFKEMKKAVRVCDKRWISTKKTIDAVEITMEHFDSYDEFYIKDFIKYFYGVIRNKTNG